MTTLSPLIAYFFRRAARAVMDEIFPPRDSSLIWKRAVEIHSASFKSQRKYSFGVDATLRYFEWNCALYRSLLEFGLIKAQAGALIEAINWKVFGPGTRVSFAMSRLCSASPMKRVRLIYDLMFRFVTAYPFQRQVLPSENEVAFDVTICPFARFFRAQRVPELTRYAACVLDSRMARDWGVEFNRTQTIGEGYPVCDFRFRIQSEARDPASKLR